mgnify:CR=1 FL=1
MKVPVYSVKGKASKSAINLPEAFNGSIRFDLNRRSVRAAQAPNST